MVDHNMRKALLIFPYILLLCNFGVYALGMVFNFIAEVLGITIISLTIGSTLKVAIIPAFVLLMFPTSRRYFYRLAQNAFAKN